jgi:hypothetical protein
MLAPLKLLNFEMAQPLAAQYTTGFSSTIISIDYARFKA